MGVGASSSAVKGKETNTKGTTESGTKSTTQDSLGSTDVVNSSSTPVSSSVSATTSTGTGTTVSVPMINITNENKAKIKRIASENILLNNLRELQFPNMIFNNNLNNMYKKFQ